MQSRALDRSKPLLFLVASLAAASALLYALVFGPKVRTIEQLRAEAEARRGRVSESLRLAGRMSEHRDEKTRECDEALARFEERVPVAPEQERFMAEMSALAVHRQLREFRLSVSDRTEGAPASSTVQGASPAPDVTSSESDSPDRASPFAEIRYRILFTSAYRGLAGFLDDVPRLRRLVALRSVNVREREGEMETTLEISIFNRGTP